jgi:hypothetical protein
MSVARELLKKYVLDKTSGGGTVDSRSAGEWLFDELRKASPEEADRLDLYGYVREASDVISSMKPFEIGIEKQMALWGDTVQALAPIGKGKFKLIVGLKEAEFHRYKEVYLADITGRRKVYDALDAMDRFCKIHWRAHPEWTVGECLKVAQAKAG